MSRHATDVIGLQSHLNQVEAEEKALRQDIKDFQEAKRLRDAIVATKANVEKLRIQYETLTRPVAEAASQ